MQEVEIFKAIANERRLQILDWLKDPRAHFPHQADGDLVEDGVCAQLIAQKLGITQATLSEHMRVLTQAGLLSAIGAGGGDSDEVAGLQPRQVAVEAEEVAGLADGPDNIDRHARRGV